MANFTVNQIQGVFGKSTVVLDSAISGGAFSVNNVQGVFGKSVPALDEAAGVVASTFIPRMSIM